MENKIFKVATLLMGNQFEISAVSDNEQNANRSINAGIDEIKRIEKLLTTFHDSSETNLINRNAGIEAVKVSEEIFNLIERSIRISSITQGALILHMVQLIKDFGILIPK
jgi:thiamine biosynthesis lipoprotein